MKLNDSEIHAVFLGALQYGFGRKTYYPGLIQDLIKERWNEIPENTKERIIYFTKDAIETNDRFAEKDYNQCKTYYLGDSIDVQGWKEFYEWCKEHE